MKKGDICEGIITDFDFPNKGSFVLNDMSQVDNVTGETKVNKRKVTIKGTLPGQKVRFQVTKKKSGMAEGRLLEVIEPSILEDAKPSCPHFGICGGCSYQTMSYENQLKHKESMVKKILDNVLLAENSNSKDYVWEGITPSPSNKNYRNKMEFTFGDECKGGELSLGLHKKNSFYDIVNVSGCEIINEDWGKILDVTLQFFREKQVPYYHRMKHEGILRNLVVRQSKTTGDFLVNLVAANQWNQYGFDSENVLNEYAMRVNNAFRGREDVRIAGILYTRNDCLGDVVACDELTLLYGQDYITENVLGLEFNISPFSFFQTNTKGCEVLYSKAREYIMSGSVMHDVQNDSEIQNNPGESGKVVFDLYSGTGTIAQLMAHASKKVIGIEIVEEAVDAAKENAKKNGLTNCEFIAGDVLKAIDLVEDKPDLIILDPPRDGINPKALEKIIAFNVDEIVYISCKPTSLARDLITLIANGYKVEKACCCDEFPGTTHVECIVCIQKIRDKKD